LQLRYQGSERGVRRYKEMFKKVCVLAFVAVMVFIFAGSSYAVCSKVICVTQPASGDTITSGSVSYIKVEINDPVVHLSKLKLYYTTVVDPPKWNLITIRNCNLFFCPTDYPWEVVWVPSTVTTARIKVELLDTNGQVVGRDQSAQFQIDPYNPGPLAVTPASDTICENDTSCSAGKVSAKFTFIGNGEPPFTIKSSHPSVIPNQSNVYYYFKVNAINDSVTLNTTVTLKITASDSQSTTVKVKVINQ
jgi:hypothetical protein